MENNGDSPIAPGKVKFFDNPLLADQSKDMVISPEQEIEQKVEMINNIESIATITKQELAVKRQQIELTVETKKLETANKTADAIEKIISAVSDADVLEKVTKNIKGPLDMKLMAEAAERLTNTLKGLMNSNVLDEMGTRKKTKINLMFKSSGPVQAAVQIEHPNDD